MTHYIYNKVRYSFLKVSLCGGLMGAFLFSSCYDLTEMSHNPYELEGNTGSGNSDITPGDDESPYADINLNYQVSAEDSAYWKEYISSVPNDFRSFLYQCY